MSVCHTPVSGIIQERFSVFNEITVWFMEETNKQILSTTDLFVLFCIMWQLKLRLQPTVLLRTGNAHISINIVFHIHIRNFLIVKYYTAAMFSFFPINNGFCAAF